jgi:DUF1680 family protein
MGSSDSEIIKPVKDLPMLGKLNRRDFVRLLAGACCFAGLPDGTKSHVLDRVRKLGTFDYSGVRLIDSPFKDQFQHARNLFVNIPNDNLLLDFRQRAGLPAPGVPMGGWYHGEDNPFGQYLSGMARMAKATDDSALLEKAFTLMEEWTKAIEPDGFFYPYARKIYTPHYIYEKTVCGLVDLCTYGGNKNAISCLERITAWAEKNLDRTRRLPRPEEKEFSANGQEWYTLPENLYRAYELTGDERYKRFGDVWRYEEYWGMFNGAAETKPGYRHAYSHLNTFSSAAMTYAVTGDPKYLVAIVNAHDWFQRTQVYATGGFGPGEQLMPPDGSLGDALDTNSATFETTCGSWAIFKLSRYLQSFTGEAKYGDWVEKILYNGIGAALPLQPDGRTFYYSDYRVGAGLKVYRDDQRWSCCSGTYPQAIADYYNLIYFHDTEGLYVNLFVPSEVSWNGIKATQETNYPESPTSNLTIHTAKPTQFTLHFRIPSWCKAASIKVNGERWNISCNPGTWASLERRWNSGDKVSLDLPMQLSYAPVDPQHPQRVALEYGPTVLVKRGRELSLDTLSTLSRQNESGRFLWKQAGGDQFVPFFSVRFREPYQMYFDLV